MSPDAGLIDLVDERLEDWNQGDVVLGDKVPFLYLADFSRPVTDGSRQAARANSEETEPLGTVFPTIPGVVVLTQSCDIVRSSAQQPFVRLAMLENARNADFLDRVRQLMEPRFAYIPGVADRSLVARLEAVMTVEKGLIAGIDPTDRIRGCRTGLEASAFAAALARNVDRFAFPDLFSDAIVGIRDRVLNKHGKRTIEGKTLEALREIRVACSPSWEDTAPELTFYFIFSDRSAIPESADSILDGLLKRFKPKGAFSNPCFRIVTLSEMSAEAYVTSQPLEFYRLSRSATRSPPPD